MGVERPGDRVHADGCDHEVAGSAGGAGSERRARLPGGRDGARAGHRAVDLRASLRRATDGRAGRSAAHRLSRRRRGHPCARGKSAIHACAVRRLSRRAALGRVMVARGAAARAVSVPCLSWTGALAQRRLERKIFPSA